MDSRFHMAYSNGRWEQLRPWIEKHNVPLLINATSRWSRNRDVFLHMRDYDTPFIIDAGGYNVQSYHDTHSPTSVQQELASDHPFYPWSVQEYHNWLSENQQLFDWACVMDYACEERFDDVWSVEQRMQSTLDNTIEQFNMDPEYDLVPVIQGRSIDQYIDFTDTLQDYGIDVSEVGLGTVCRLSNTNEIISVEQELRERTDIERMHGFGVKIGAYKKGVNFESADSAAWNYPSASGRMLYLSAENGNITTKRVDVDSNLMATVESFMSYYTYVTHLKSGSYATPLDERLEFTHLYETGQIDSEGDYLRWIDW